MILLKKTTAKRFAGKNCSLCHGEICSWFAEGDNLERNGGERMNMMVILMVRVRREYNKRWSDGLL